ncbi:hypothetical protein PLICRDRAFT_31586 [Plicaturopsis crispa FD-325 SS-3]|nr:hypothetical protein PLICRDRAFT_31586 [Plicaturopsis crispa FD-325 SS-3]
MESDDDTSFRFESGRGEVLPPAQRHMIPIEGSYVVFRVDPVLTVKALKDPWATAMAKNLKPKNYVGFVTRICEGGYNSYAQFLGVQLTLLCRGLPERVEAKGTEPDMCLPVLPTTAHPTSRKPLAPSKPLPWTNCYHYTTYRQAYVRVPGKWVNNADVAPIRTFYHSTTDEYPILFHQMEDLRRRAALRAVYEAAHPEARDSESDGDKTLVSDGSVHNDDSPVADDVLAVNSDQPIDDSPWNDDASCDYDAASEGDPDNASGDGSHADTEATHCSSFPPPRAWDPVLDGAEPSPTATTVRVTYDLNTIQDFGSPAQYFNEYSFLEFIVEQSKARTVEKARRRDEWKHLPFKAKLKSLFAPSAVRLHAKDCVQHILETLEIRKRSPFYEPYIM